MEKLIIVFGTRPEVIKLAPVIEEFRDAGKRESIFIVNSNQHRDLPERDLEYFNIDVDYTFTLKRHHQSLSELNGALMLEFSRLGKYLTENKITARAVIAQGDTATTFCSAMFSFYEKIPFIHIEAGLRIYDLNEPFPEEFYRKTISTLSAFNFVPTLSAKENLLSEGIPGHKIIITGNTVIDNLRKRIKEQRPDWHTDKKGIILITIHRRENREQRLDLIFRKISILCKRNPGRQFIWITHPGVDYDYFNSEKPGNLDIIPPVSFAEMIQYYARTALIITDSGGIQEEASYLGIPSLIFRAKTERTEGIESGISKYLNGQLININQAVSITGQEFNTLYGDGFASKRIVDHLAESYLSSRVEENRAISYQETII